MTKLSDIILTGKNSIPDKIEGLLLQGTSTEKIEIIKLVIQYKLKIYQTLLQEIMLFEDEPTVRTYAFHAVALLGGREVVNDLLEAIVTEIHPEYKISMIDMFKLYATKNSISLENISLDLPVVTTPKAIIELQVASQSVAIQDDQKLIVQDRTTDDLVKQRVIDYIAEMTTDIPISLHRMADILNIETKVLQRYLKGFAKEFPDAATYLDFEQVFIKTPVTIRTMIDPQPIRTVNCTNCGKDTASFPCENCGKGLQCSTCRLTIGNNEETLTCPYCRTSNHKRHITEWLRIKGNCPNCKESVKLAELI